MAKKDLDVQGTKVKMLHINNTDYISITDIAKIRNPIEPKDVVKNWMRSKNTLIFLGLWEKLNNPTFKGVEFDPLMYEAGTNAFTMSPTRWVELTSATGVVTKNGANGGTYAHRDIAFEFASWVNTEFKLYLITEFQRLKEQEQQQLGWSAKRELSKINYHIHTDAVKHNLIPDELTPQQISIVYANEADVLNMALFGITAKQWREANPDLKGNIRDYATINELICLSNMENINAVLINEQIPQSERLQKLNQIAIQQMRVLQEVENRKLLK
ncbi:KilA-N domain-containing protein [Dysgonomonas sp. GY75]|uniref:KilA-N domain-containing protein n=1 Tax=Dysgonomonas sp. GY75 TaxID=2780419 RepID=UPI0018838A73|nr:KilA-N domain-containing protein [Dysgonomonas sp. GY75]MBF0647361.1 KilA-N domain-containing protein [Dysgonomonas sp. GY75]